MQMIRHRTSILGTHCVSMILADGFLGLFLGATSTIILAVLSPFLPSQMHTSFSWLTVLQGLSIVAAISLAFMALVGVNVGFLSASCAIIISNRSRNIATSLASVLRYSSVIINLVAVTLTMWALDLALDGGILENLRSRASYDHSWIGGLVALVVWGLVLFGVPGAAACASAWLAANRTISRHSDTLQ
jgi:hypothetical protein